MIKVLVVDDEKDVEDLFRQQFRRELRQKTVELHFAASGEAALHFMKTLDPFDLVLLMSDINMPGMSGLELLRAAKSLYPELQVFIITAYEDERNYWKAKEYGADEFFTKPVDFTKLRANMLNLGSC